MLRATDPEFNSKEADTDISSSAKKWHTRPCQKCLNNIYTKLPQNSGLNTQGPILFYIIFINKK